MLWHIFLSVADAFYNEMKAMVSQKTKSFARQTDERLLEWGTTPVKKKQVPLTKTVQRLGSATSIPSQPDALHTHEVRQCSAASPPSVEHPGSVKSTSSQIGDKLEATLPIGSGACGSNSVACDANENDRLSGVAELPGEAKSKGEISLTSPPDDDSSVTSLPTDSVSSMTPTPADLKTSAALAPTNYKTSLTPISADLKTSFALAPTDFKSSMTPISPDLKTSAALALTNYKTSLTPTPADLKTSVALAPTDLWCSVKVTSANHKISTTSTSTDSKSHSALSATIGNSSVIAPVPDMKSSGAATLEDEGTSVRTLSPDDDKGSDPSDCHEQLQGGVDCEAVKRNSESEGPSDAKGVQEPMLCYLMGEIQVGLESHFCSYP